MQQTTRILALCSLVFSFPLFAQNSMQEITEFGPNPGALRLFVYQPETLEGPAPVVVALHGCLQDAATYSRESGWNELADQYGFRVLYPEQVNTNHPNRCFSWFQDEDINRDQGEAASIAQMVQYLDDLSLLDEEHVYVTGLSAGGCMTAVMLATYPERFTAGAVMAGIPYKASTSVEHALSAMRGEVDQSSEQWDALVREQNPDYEGTYPRLAIFHGLEDEVVSRQNMDELVEQWTHLHDIRELQVQEEIGFADNPNVTRKTYFDADHRAVVMTYEVAEMGHALAVNPGAGPQQGGATGQFAVDVDFFYSYWAAAFFGLLHP